VIKALADKFNCSFYETSAAQRRHVDDVFHSLVREIRARDVKHDTKVSNVSKWKKLWSYIFRKMKGGRK